MRAAWAFLRVFVVTLLSVASGTLECDGRPMTDSELRGATLYKRMCAVCHGDHGQGYAADNAPAIANRGFLATASDRLILSAIADGRSGTTMSAWSFNHGGPLMARDQDAIASYLRTFETLPHVSLDNSPARGNAARGASEFRARCENCHGEHGIGGPYVHIGSPDFLSAAGNGLLRTTIHDGREGTRMPAFGRELGTDGIENIVAALRKWQSETPREVRPPAPHPPPLPLGPVPLNPRGPEPDGFREHPATTPADIVKRELDRGAKMALLDARAQSDYLAVHITGAVSVPFFDPDPYIDRLPRDAWLVCYCSCPHAESGDLARKLVDKGFKKVTVLDEGLGVWHARRYPTTTGPDP